jgi:hypothetical protein
MERALQPSRLGILDDDLIGEITKKFREKI